MTKLDDDVTCLEQGYVSLIDVAMPQTAAALAQGCISLIDVAMPQTGRSSSAPTHPALDGYDVFLCQSAGCPPRVPVFHAITHRPCTAEMKAHTVGACLTCYHSSPLHSRGEGRKSKV